jgi:outer membrane protein OmpA-like peptidoglycan-associated protein
MPQGHHRIAVSILAFLLASAGPTTFAAEKHSTLALSFREGQSSEVSIVGVSPLATRLGQADIKRSQGRTRIKLRIDEELPHPQALDPLYTTYVLWAVAPEGRAESLVELPHGRGIRVEATTALPAFGLIVTAEPYAAVTRPGWRLVAQSAPGDRTRGRMQATTLEYQVEPERHAVGGRSDFKTPLLVLGARRAIEMAQAAGAPEFAEAELREAEVKQAALEQLWSRKSRLSKDEEAMARDVMRLAEHARNLSADRMAQAGRAAERRQAQAAIVRAQTEADRAAIQAEQERVLAERARRQAESERQDAERARQEALQAKQVTRLAETEAERARANEELARSEAESAKREAEQARQENTEMQEQLFRSLSAILDTRREARGLIVSLSDVLFDFNRASLKPGAREKLSKLAGILLAYPGPYAIEIEGHTDSVGSDEYNLRLSRDRAQSVSAYVREAGIPAARITQVGGFGESRPVASNDNDAGRQMNRRVELVITDLER